VSADESRPADNGTADEECLVSDASDSHNTVGYAQISTVHADELAASAIPLDVAIAAGVYSATCRDELPVYGYWTADRNGDAVFPTLVYPMVEHDGTETGQIKPSPGSVTSADGGILKYVSPAQHLNPPKLPVLREVDAPRIVLIVEGVKQALAALAWAPTDWSVYRITGIWAWSVADPNGPSSPTPHLAAVQGRDVVIVPDADATTNINVFDGAASLGEACTAYGATNVKFGRLPAGGKDGLDDVLVRLANDDARRAFVTTLAGNAKPRPADIDAPTQRRMRTARKHRRSVRADGQQAAADNRVEVNLGEAPRTVSLALVDALSERSGGKHLFRRDSELVRLRRDDHGALSSSDLNFNALHRELLDVVYPVRPSFDGERLVPSGVPQEQLGLVADHAERFPRLNGITRAPIVRADGSIATTSGYDAATGLFLDLLPELAGIDVPEKPTDEEIAAATALIRDDLLAMDGDGGFDGFVFQSVADQTNAAAALITTVVRAWSGPAPMFLFDGIQPGVGKGGLADVIHLTAYGTPMPFQPAPRSNDEMDKRITAELLSGSGSICLDEVQDQNGDCRLDHGSLRAALTATIYSSRRLGESEMLKLPQLATWFGLGNNIRVPGDMARRTVQVRLASDRTDLETRGNFRHELAKWVPENRVALLHAVLILVRAWFDRGQPAAPKPFHFASFGEWQRIVGGILHLAKFDCFLGNVLKARASSNDLVLDWEEHLEWLERSFKSNRFSASDAMLAAKCDPASAAPYARSFVDLDAQLLSKLWGQNPRWFGGLRVRAAGKLHAGKKAYVVERQAPPSPGSASTVVPSDPTNPGGMPDVRERDVITTQDRHGFTEEHLRRELTLAGTKIKDLKR